jgi:RNA polymerase sigma-70 factor (ECF subfamily)
LGSRADADDVLQETFARLAAAPDKLARVQNLTAYVFTVARNEAARLQARNAREHRRRAALDAADLYCEASGDDPAAREAAEALFSALARLSDAEREVVELKTYGELTLQEIADVTGAPLGTVATRYRAALARLRGWLQRTCHE